MVDKASKVPKGHQFVLESREKLSVSGVHKVQSFDPKIIVLETQMGILCIKGDRLAIKQMNLQDGLVDIEGYVDALSYQKNTSGSGKQSLWSKVFR